LIDDEKDFCYFVKKNLESSGEYSVTVSNDPDQGLAMARKNHFDLILTDILMPRKDGFSVLDELKKDEKTCAVPVVMLTALGDDESKQKASQLYGEEFLTKPVTFEALKYKISEVLRRHKRVV
jgi:two-component system response regulator RpaA